MPSFNRILVENYAALFSCTAVVKDSDLMMASTLSFKYTLSPSSNWSLFKLIFSDQALMKLK